MQTNLTLKNTSSGSRVLAEELSKRKDPRKRKKTNNFGFVIFKGGQSKREGEGAGRQGRRKGWLQVGVGGRRQCYWFVFADGNSLSAQKKLGGEKLSLSFTPNKLLDAGSSCFVSSRDISIFS